MRFLVYGEDTFMSGRRLAQLRESFGNGDIVTVNAGKNGLAELSEAVLTVSFFGGNKLVIAKGFLQALKDIQSGVSALLERVPKEITLVFYEDVARADLSKSILFSDLDAQKESREYPAIREQAVGQIFSDEMRRHGITLSPEAARQATAVLPTDSWQIVQEAEKLAAWCKAQGKQRAELSDLTVMTSGDQEERTFAFLDACLDGDLKQATKLMEETLNSGVSEYQLLASIMRQVRTLVAVRDYIDAGVADKMAIASKLKMHPFPVGKAMVPARRMSPSLLKKIFNACLDVEMEMKTSQTGREAIEVLAVKLTAAAR